MMHRGGNLRRNDAFFGESIVGRAENICVTVTGLLVECYRSILSFLLSRIAVEALASTFFVIKNKTAKATKGEFQ